MTARSRRCPGAGRRPGRLSPAAVAARLGVPAAAAAPLRRMPRRLLMLLPALVLGAVRLRGAARRALPMPAGAGGAVGWGCCARCRRSASAAFALPLAMGAAALVALMLLSIMGLSHGRLARYRQRRRARREPARARFGPGAVIGGAAAGSASRSFHRWRAARRERQAATGGDPRDSARRGRGQVDAPCPGRRWPPPWGGASRNRPAAPAATPPRPLAEAGETGGAAGRPRLVMPRAPALSARARRAGLQPALDC